MNSPEKVLYTAIVTATGGRDGSVVSSDNVLNVKLSVPQGLGGRVALVPIQNNCLLRVILPASLAP